MDPILDRKVREEEMQYVKKHAVYETVSMSQCWEETGKNSTKTGWEDTNKGTSECREGIQHWTKARLVQCNLTSGGSEARHLGSSVKQPEGDSALGD